MPPSDLPRGDATGVTVLGRTEGRHGGAGARQAASAAAALALGRRLPGRCREPGAAPLEASEGAPDSGPRDPRAPWATCGTDCRAHCSVSLFSLVSVGLSLFGEPIRFLGRDAIPKKLIGSPNNESPNDTRLNNETEQWARQDARTTLNKGSGMSASEGSLTVLAHPRGGAVGKSHRYQRRTVGFLA